MRRVLGSCAVIVAAAVCSVAAHPQTAQGSPAARPSAPAIALMAAAIPTGDLARSVAFYTSGLGLTVGTRLEFPTATEVVLTFPGGGASLSLMLPKSPQPPPPARTSLDRVIFDVPDLRALEARLRSAGYALAKPLVEQPRYKILVATVADPDGNVIELVQRPH